MKILPRFLRSLAWRRETPISEMQISLSEDLPIVVMPSLRPKDLPLSGPSMAYNVFKITLPVRRRYGSVRPYSVVSVSTYTRVFLPVGDTVDIQGFT